MSQFSRFLLLAVVATGALACAKDKGQPARGTPPAADAPSIAFQVQVNARLHKDRLIAIPAVRQASKDFVAKYQSGQMTREAAAQAFLVWMQDYEKQHPEEVAAARKGPGQAPRPR